MRGKYNDLLDELENIDLIIVDYVVNDKITLENINVIRALREEREKIVKEIGLIERSNNDYVI